MTVAHASVIAIFNIKSTSFLIKKINFSRFLAYILFIIKIP